MVWWRKEKFETDTSFTYGEDQKIVGLFQAKRDFYEPHLSVMFNQHCADTVAYIQNQLVWYAVAV